MNKRLPILVAALSLTPILQGANLRLEASVQYFEPRDELFRAIYGGGAMTGAQVHIRVWKGLGLWIGGRRFSREGETTFTHENIRVTVLPVAVGLDYRLKAGGFDLYAGAGLARFDYRETDILGPGEVRKRSFGTVARAGNLVHPVPLLVIDFFLEYSSSRITPVADEIQIGGVSTGVGIGVEF
ncbi:MAG: hypothetical protein ACE5LV_03045 [Candidatus Aminicenantales bacterium]